MLFIPPFLLRGPPRVQHLLCGNWDEELHLIWVLHCSWLHSRRMKLLLMYWRSMLSSLLDWYLAKGHLCWNKRRKSNKGEKIRFVSFDLSELVRQTDSVHTSNVNYLYYLNRIKGKRIDEINGNYTGNERSRAVKLRGAVPGVADIARARNSHFNISNDLLRSNVRERLGSNFWCGTKVDSHSLRVRWLHLHPPPPSRTTASLHTSLL